MSHQMFCVPPSFSCTTNYSVPYLSIVYYPVFLFYPVACPNQCLVSCPIFCVLPDILCHTQYFVFCLTLCIVPKILFHPVFCVLLKSLCLTRCLLLYLKFNSHSVFWPSLVFSFRKIFRPPQYRSPFLIFYLAFSILPSSQYFCLPRVIIVLLLFLHLPPNQFSYYISLSYCIMSSDPTVCSSIF